MTKKGKYDRLTKCPSCHGEGSIWDAQLKDFTIECETCVGEGQLCGECYFDVDSCKGEGVCWEQDPEEYYDPTEDY